jgi:hypothetical protein
MGKKLIDDGLKAVSVDLLVSSMFAVEKNSLPLR